jgi:hypothetical protein
LLTKFIAHHTEFVHNVSISIWQLQSNDFVDLHQV